MQKLPKIATASFETELIADGRKVSYRPFIVKEEKQLLMAIQSKDINTIIKAIKETIDACILTDGISVDELASFDIEKLFLLIRGKAVGEAIEIEVGHPEEDDTDCNYRHTIELDIDKIKTVVDEKHNRVVRLSENPPIGLKMNYPTIDMIKYDEENPDDLVSIIALSIDQFYEGDDATDASEFSLEERIEFIESLDKTNFKKIGEFFNTMPHLSYSTTYKCPKCEKDVEIKLDKMSDFFM